MTEKDTSKNGGEITPTKKTGQSFKDLAPLDQFKVVMQKEYQKAIENFFAGDKQATMKFMSAVMYSFQRVPNLAKCDRASLIQSFMTCAEFKLYPSGVSGEAYILPYENKKKGTFEAQFQLGYQGVVTLLYRAGMKNITAEIVYKNDEFSYETGLSTKLTHKPNIFGERGEAIGVYAVATLPSGEKQFKIFSKADIMKFKEFSKSKNSEFSPWNAKNDPELSMWKKTAIKQLYKFLPKNSEVFEAFDRDNRDSTISDVKPLLENSDLKMGNFLVEKKKTSEIIYDNDNADQTNQNENEKEIQIGETDSADGIK